MEKKKGHLSLEERQILYVMRSEGKSFAEIGRMLQRDPTNLSREMKRNRPQSHIARHMRALERASFAQDKTRKRQKEKVAKQGCRLDRHAEARLRIEALLRETYFSAEQIAKIISQSDLGVAFHGKTLRRWVKKNCPDFQKHFPHRGKRRVMHLTPKRRNNRVPDGALPKRSIHERPQDITERLRAGDLELDMLVCNQSTASILSIRDRKTRHCWLDLVTDLKAPTVRRAIIKFVQNIPPLLRQSATYDRGTEFAEVHQLEHSFGLVNYFCDAYCAWQKGSVENQNKEVRRYIPKGTDLSKISRAQLKRIEQLINAKPRLCLNGVSAGDAWFIEARKAQHALH